MTQIRQPSTKTPGILFLDMDGVLVTPRSCWATGTHRFDQLDPIGIQIIDRLCADFNLQLVISSVWRVMDSMPKLLGACGMRAQLHRDWRTPVIGQKRGEEIKSWLADHPEHKIWVILDDEVSDMAPEHSRRIVKTDQENGILWRHYQQAEKILKEMGAGL